MGGEMGREIRRVPENWEHPKNENGYIPLAGYSFIEHLRTWNEGNEMWKAGLYRCYREGGPDWEPIDLKHKHKYMSYVEYAGPKPELEKYMPEWPDAERTHVQMYETCTEGTPISPVLATPEKMAKWLTDNKANAFAGQIASYDAWLQVCKGNSAPSAACVLGVGMVSGVEAMYNDDKAEKK